MNPTLKFSGIKPTLMCLTILTCLGLVGLGGCATSGSSTAGAVPAIAPVPVQIQESGTESDTFFLTDIGVSTLPERKCGMVLWTVDANRPIPVLRYVSGDTGLMSLNRVPFELLRLEAEGRSAFGIFESQRFAAGTDIVVNVDIELGQGFDGGSYLKRGVVRVERPDEPILVTPVAGIAGCRS